MDHEAQQKGLPPDPLTLDERFFIRIALKNRLLDEAQASELIRLQKGLAERGQRKAIEALVLDYGLLAPDAVDAIHQAQEASHVHRLDQLYAGAARRLSLADPDAIDRAVEAQGERAYTVNLGELLVERGVLSPADHRRVLAELRSVLERAEAPPAAAPAPSETAPEAATPGEGPPLAADLPGDGAADWLGESSIDGEPEQRKRSVSSERLLESAIQSLAELGCDERAADVRRHHLARVDAALSQAEPKRGRPMRPVPMLVAGFALTFVPVLAWVMFRGAPAPPAAPEPAPAAAPESVSTTVPAPGSAPVPVPESEPVSEAAPVPESAPESAAVPEPEPVPLPEPGPVPESAPEPAPEAVPEAASVPVPVPVPVPASVPEPVAEAAPPLPPPSAPTFNALFNAGQAHERVGRFEDAVHAYSEAALLVEPSSARKALVNLRLKVCEAHIRASAAGPTETARPLDQGGGQAAPR